MIGNPLLLPDEGYNISRSVRLRSSASAFFSRTPASAGNRRTWTWSGWVKRGSLGSPQRMLFSSATGTTDATHMWIGFADNFGGDELNVQVWGGSLLQLPMRFRDPAAWYHIVVQFDTTQATQSNRIRVYVNGQLQTPTINQAALNTDYAINSTQAHGVGYNNYSTGSGYFDGYLTEINFIDGQALTPSSFGETDAITGVWKPKKYTGTYGTNGFYLNFSDNSNNTAATIGKDYSGNGNNWTPNNISVTAGVTYDSMLDVPTQWADGGNGRGNYCTLNPLAAFATGASASNGNLRLTVTSSGGNLRPTIGATSGKYYAEFTITDIGGNSGTSFSIQTAGPSLQGSPIINAIYYVNGQTYNYATASFTSYGASYTTGDVIGVAWDIDNKQVTFYKNNTSQGTLSGSAITPSNATEPVVALAATSGGTGTTIVDNNFGQRPFAYTPPSGFRALNTLNLPAPTILKGNQFFDATLYTGTGASLSVTNSGAMQPDLVWIKKRNSATNGSHQLVDAVRGTSAYLFTDATNAEGTATDRLTAFNSNGFSLSTASQVNGNTDTYVAWQWKEGATQGFDIVTYTGSASAQNISHSLGVAPKLVIVKARGTPNGAARDWLVWHGSFTSTEYIFLNSTAAKSSASGSLYWNSTLPNSTQFSVGTDPAVNWASNNYVAYLFSEVAGFSRFGSYTGNGSTDGPFVFCGFRPRWIMFKKTSATDDWVIYDTARDDYNVASKNLYANGSFAEDSNTTNRSADILSNGFKLRSSGTFINGSGATFIFAAFAESPFKNALAR